MRPRLPAFPRPDRHILGLIGEAVYALLPGALIVYLSFNAGGYFPNTVGYVVVALAALLALRVLLVTRPFEGFNSRIALAAGALALYAAWVMLSGIWSDAPARALVEFDRVTLYLLTLLLLGAGVQTWARLAWMLRGIVAAIAIVCIIALITRVLPDVWPIGANLADNRLSYPLTYWNALGILAALGIVFAFHMACATDVSRAERIIGSALVPVLATTLFFTFSRGAIAACAIGLVAYVAIARPGAVVNGVVATVPLTALSVAVAYDANLLATLRPTTDAAVSQGHDVAGAVAFSVVAAAALRALLVPLDERLHGLHLSRRARSSLVTVAGIAVIVGALAVNLPGDVSEQYERFTEGTPVRSTGDLRQRLTDPGNNGRLAQWDVALEGFAEAPLHGEGAGTYELLWDRDRPAAWRGIDVVDAHSLYIEVLGELGIVGFLLLAASLATIVLALAVGAQWIDRSLFGAFLAATIAWLFHAGVDWDWEAAAVSVWLFAAGGAVLAARAPSWRRPPSFPTRALIVVGCAALAAPAALIASTELEILDATQALGRGDCEAALADADSARSQISFRAEPHQLRGYCYARQGLAVRSVAAMEVARGHDPRNWQYAYGLAIVRGAAGLDPRPAAAAALRLNRFEPLARQAAAAFHTDEPRRWRREARRRLRELSP